MTVSIEIRNTSDTAINDLNFGRVDAGKTSTATTTLRLYNAGDSTPSELLFGVLSVTGSYSGDTNPQGQEAVTEKWVQARVGTAAYTAIGGNLLATTGTTLSLTPLSAGASVDVDLRLVVPAGASTGGNYAFVPLAFYPKG